jgi:hypothetical protein
MYPSRASERATAQPSSVTFNRWLTIISQGIQSTGLGSPMECGWLNWTQVCRLRDSTVAPRNCSSGNSHSDSLHLTHRSG